MRKIMIIFFMAVISKTVHAQIKTTFSADNDTVSVRQIINLEYKLAELLEKGDIDTYSGFLTDDYIRISANGQVATKQEVLQSSRRQKAKIKMEPHDIKVRVFGDAAIMRAVLELETQTSEGLTRRRSLITKVFIRREGKWYLASLQGTPAQ